MIFTIFACGKNDDVISNEITGTYIGTITSDLLNKSNISKTSNATTAAVGHVMGHKNMHNNGSEWMQHLGNEHQNGDEHFGSFNMQHHSFNYTFKKHSGDFHFLGTKN